MFQQDLKKLQKLLLVIPKGRVTTYGILAKVMDMPRKSRYIGRLLGLNPCPDKYPCYKVVKSDGSVGGYSNEDGIKEKIRRLSKDNVIINKRRIVDFESKIFKFNMS